MRLHLGPPPENADFQPLKDGWTLLKEPRFSVLALMATVVGILVAILTLMAWEAIATNAKALTTLPTESPLIFFLVGLVSVVVVHEFVHATGYPRFGLNDETLIAFWPSKVTCYVFYSGTLSRDRWLLTYVLPFLVLSMLPLAICSVFGVVLLELMFISVVNAFCCGGDLFIVGQLIMRQVPRKAVMRNQGWATWWKEDQPQPH
jgi:hypothetical protein